MMPEQQQRILGYFIEEAKDHLNTIEQGLLNLQSTIQDPEMVTEVFRAAHSVKGGAAMLSLGSIQQTSHRLEDYFKILKETPTTQVDRDLETMFLQVFDGLQALLEELQGPFGLTDEKAQEVMADIEPVFDHLESHLNDLVAAAPATAPQAAPVATAVSQPAARTIASSSEDSALKLVFSSDVPGHLREMLTLFKQADTATSRTTLQACCDALKRVGEQFDLSLWCDLTHVTRQVVGNPEQTYRSIAPVVIKELKRAQEQVLSGQANAIAIAAELESLLPLVMDTDAAVEDIDALLNDALSTTEEPDLTDLFAADTESVTDADADLDWLDLPDDAAAIPDSDASATDDLAASLSALTDNETVPEAPREPTVGAAELNSLADLFEGEVAELDSPWEEISESEAAIADTPNPALDLETDFSDLLEGSLEEDTTDNSNDLADLFGNTSEFTDPAPVATPASETHDDLDDLLNLDITPSDTDDSNSDTDDVGLDSLLDSVDSDTANDHADTVNVLDLEPEAASEGLDFDLELDETPEPETGTADFGDLFDADEITSTAELATAELDLEAELNLEDDLTTDAVDPPDTLEPIAASEPTPEPSEGEIATAFTEIDDPWSTTETDAEAVPDDEASALDALDELWTETATPDADEPVTTSQDFDDFPELGEEENAPLETADTVATDDLDDLFVDSREDAPITEPSLDLDDTSLALDDLSPISDSTAAIETDFDDLLGSSTTEETATGTEADLGGLFDENPATTDTDLDFLDLSDGDTEDATTAATADVDDLLATPTSVNNDDDDDSHNVANEINTSGVDALFNDVTAAPADMAIEAEQAADDDFDLTFADADDEALTLASETEAAALETDAFGEEASDDDDDLFAETDAALTDAAGIAVAHADDDFFGSDASPEPTPEVANATSDDIDDFFTTTPEATTTPEVAPTAVDEFIDLTDDTTTESTLSNITDPAFDLTEDGLDDLNLESSVEGVVSESDSLSEAADLDPLGLDNIEFTDETDDSTDLDLSNLDVATLDSEPDSLFETPASDESSHDADTEIDDLDFDLDDISATPDTTAAIADLEGNDSDIDIELDDLDFGLTDTTEAPETAAAIADFDGSDRDADIELDDLDFGLTDTTEAPETPAAIADLDGSDRDNSFDDLDAMLSDDTTDMAISDEVGTDDSEFDELDALLDSEPPADASLAAVTDSAVDFDELDALIGEDSASEDIDPGDSGEDEFGDLEKLLEEADQTLGGGASSMRSPGPSRSSRRVGGIVDQTMRVSVKHLDNLNNLVGELVVNRNSLEQDQDRFRQFLDNLLFQVQQLNDVGQRMRDLYERSLLESSLLASRQAFQAGGSRLSTTSNGNNSDSHATGASFDALEMDRFTGFHTLTQEMIELIVRVRESSSDIAYTVESTDQIARQFRQVTTQLQEGLNKARMVPFAQTADRLPRAVRDISIKCGKEARLVVEGRDTLIDKMLLERLYDPMTHLVNNAITHGIESPEERAALGKPREGKITVRAFYQGNQTVIYIEDDGAGINPDLLKRKAIQKGLITQAEAERMNKLETYELIFNHGFTTREQADDFAGRGVGMDVVRTALSEIRGSINIDSELGKGTSFTIRLPLTLSISKALSCLNNQARIAFPMDGVEDMFDVPRERVQTNDDEQSYIQWRDMSLTFQPLSDLLQFNRALGRGRVYGGSQDDDMVSIVVLRNANTYIGIQVDRVLGEQEIVIKQIEGPVPKPMGIAGATVLGDGRVMPIGDVLELIDIAQGRVRREAGSSIWSQVELPPEEEAPVKSEPTVLIVDDSITVRELLSMSFNKVGYRVEQARDGQEAWEKMRSGLPCDLVFCDIEMPRMDGLELLSRMQKDSMLKNIPIAMLTSRGADRHRQMAVDLGASGYFTKPYLEEALLEAAQKMLQGEVLIGAAAEEAE